jgi:hypothetical protein
MTWLPRNPCSTLVLWFNQETVHRLHLAVLATMRPALDPAGHRVPQTKPTCLLHTWRPHRQKPFALVLHLHQHESSLNLHLQYLAQESVHTTLSITHHTRKRPSTGPRTTHGPHLLARPQACRPDRQELMLRRLPRLASLPGGNTTSSNRGAHSNRGGDYQLQSRLS